MWCDEGDLSHMCIESVDGIREAVQKTGVPAELHVEREGESPNCFIVGSLKGDRFRDIATDALTVAARNGTSVRVVGLSSSA